jgi:hypothetical protein
MGAGCCNHRACRERGASQFRDGELVSAEIIEKHARPELAYVVEIERGEAKIGGREEMTPWVLTNYLKTLTIGYHRL